MRKSEAYREVGWREYVDTRFVENQRALDVVASERDRAAEVLRDEQRRAISVAETEREKAAAALRAGTDRAISDNYARLREQLEASEKLLITMVDASNKESRAIQTAAKEAIQKAEEAQQRVNIGQNEFRGSLSDLTSTMLPRREAEAALADHLRQIGELKDRVGELRQVVAVGSPDVRDLQTRSSNESGRRQGAIDARAALYSFLIILAGAAAALSPHIH